MLKAVIFIILFPLGLMAQINSLEKKTVEAADYNTTRNLKDYKNALEDHFSEDVENLKSGDVWIDSGAGESLPQTDYILGLGKATTIAIDARPPTSSLTLGALKKYRGRYKFLKGRYIEAYAPIELPQAKIITDV